MRSFTWIFVILLLAAPFLAAQDEPAGIGRTLHMGKGTEKASAQLKACVAELKELLDLDTMQEEVSALIDMSRDERGQVFDALESFRNHWLGDSGISIQKDSGRSSAWFNEIVDDATGILDPEDAGSLARWFKIRRKAADKCAQKIEKSAAELGEAAGRMAEEIAESVAGNIEAMTHIQGKDWQKLTEGLTRQIQELTEQHQHEYSKAAAEYAKAAQKKAFHAQQLGTEIHEKIMKAIDIDALERIKELAAEGKLDGGELSETIQDVIKDSLSGLEDFDINLKDLDITLDLLGDLDLRNDLLENFDFRHGEFKIHMEDYAKEMSEAAAKVREDLEQNRQLWELHSDKHWKAIEDAMDLYRDALGGITIGIGDDDEKVEFDIQQALEALKAARAAKAPRSPKAPREPRPPREPRAGREHRELREQKELQEIEEIDRQRIKSLKRTEESIKLRDLEIRELRKQVDELKKQLKQMEKQRLNLEETDKNEKDKKDGRLFVSA